MEKLGTDGQIALNFLFSKLYRPNFFKGTGKITCVAWLRSYLACKLKKDNFIHFSYFLKEVFA